MVRATGFFSAEEIGMARELADDGLNQGAASHYRFLLADNPAGVVGYACFGPVPCTRAAWDLYWIAVAPGTQRNGVGRRILESVEAEVLRSGGTRIYADTSSRLQYAPTRKFYGQRGYHAAAEFPDFYAPGDGKIVFLKILGSGKT